MNAELFRYGGQLIVTQQKMFQRFYLRQTNIIVQQCTQSVRVKSAKVTCTAGGAEFAGQENDGQRNFRGWKLQDWKMTDKSAGVENAGLEIDGQKCSR